MEFEVDDGRGWQLFLQSCVGKPSPSSTSDSMDMPRRFF